MSSTILTEFVTYFASENPGGYAFPAYRLYIVDNYKKQAIFSQKLINLLDILIKIVYNSICEKGFCGRRLPFAGSYEKIKERGIFQ